MKKDQFNRRVFSIQEASNYAGVSRGIVDMWIKNKLLPYEELPSYGNKYRLIRIRKSDLDKFLDNKRSIGVQEPVQGTLNETTSITLLPKSS